MKFYSVTEVLKPYSDFSKISKDVLESACIRGSEVHRICALVARGIFVREIPDECKGYVLSFCSWLDVAVEEVLAVEEELRDETLGLIGHPDLIPKMKEGFVAVVDLKTPIALRKTWQGQLSTYLELAKKKYDVKKAGSLRLHPKGKMAKMIWYEDNKRDYLAVISALNAIRYFSEK